MNQPSQPGSRDTQSGDKTTLGAFSDAGIAGIWANFAHREQKILEQLMWERSKCGDSDRQRYPRESGETGSVHTGSL